MAHVDKANLFWKNESARLLLEQFEKTARAAGYDFFLVISEHKTKDYRTLYHCEAEGHLVLTNAMDESYQKLLAWYEAQGASAGSN